MKKKPRYFGYFRSSWLKILLVTVLRILATAGNFVETLLMSDVVDKLPKGSSSLASLLWLATILLAVEVAGYTANFIADKKIMKIKESVHKKIYFELAKALANSTVESVTQNEPSEITKRIREGSTFIDSLYAIFQECFTLAIGIAAIIYTACCAWQVAIFIGVFMTVIILTQNSFRQKLKKANIMARSVSEKSEQMLLEIVTGFMDVKVQNLVRGLKQYLLNAYDKEIEENVAVEELAKNNSFFSKSLMALYKFSFLALSLLLFSKGSITFEQFVALFMYKGYTYGTVFSMLQLTKSISVCQTSMKRMNEIFNEEKVRKEQFGNQELLDPRGTLEVENLTLVRNGMTVLDGVCMNLEPGGYYGIAGPSGSGKSSLLKCIAGLLTIQGGKIQVDGIETKELTEGSFHRTIRLVPQNSYLFPMLTLRENLCVAKPNASDEEIWDALNRSAATKFVEEKGGLDAAISPKNLSGGERQRLSLARTILAGGKIILLDESTSALDSDAQAAIVDTIEAAKQNHTIVMVAHRVQTLKNADCIFFMKEGKIVARGTYEDLYNNFEDFQKMADNG